MKYTLILFLACVPLVVLTGRSFVDAVLGSGHFAVAPSSAANAHDAEVQKAALDSKSSGDAAGTDLLFVDQLAATSLWEMPAKQSWTSAGDELKAVVEPLQQFTLGRQLVDRFAPLADRLAARRPAASDSIAERREKAETARAKIEEFNKKYRAEYVDAASGEKVRGAAALFELLDRRSNAYTAEVAKLDLLISIAKSLPIARDDLDRGQYKECAELLAADPLDQATAPETLAEIELLRKRARFGLDLAELGSRNKAGPRDRDLLLLGDAFLAKYAKVPTAAEEAKLSQVRQWRDQLEADLLCDELKKIDELEPLLERAAAVVKHKARDAKHIEQARQAVTDWLATKGFPRMQPPADLAGKQEAWTKNGQRLFGYFDLPAGVEQWRYWRDAKGFNLRDPLLGDQEIPRSSFTQDPVVPKYVEWATQYNTDTARLISQPSTKEQWQSFIEWCGQTDEDLVSYRNRRGVGVDNEPDRSCASWTFSEQAAVARTVIAKWDEFQRVMRD
jgi:hypothetical protein